MTEQLPESIYHSAPMPFFQQKLHDHLSTQTDRIEAAIRSGQPTEEVGKMLQQRFTDLAETTRSDFRAFCQDQRVSLDTSAMEQTVSDLEANVQVGLDNIGSTMRIGFTAIASLMDDACEELEATHADINAGFEQVGAWLDWGFSGLLAQAELQNEKLSEITQILLRPVTTEVRELLKKARRDYRNGFMDESLESLLYLLEERRYRVVLSTYFPIHILIADILLLCKHDHARAIQYYESAIRYLPADTNRLKALLLLNLARCHHLKGDNERARELARESGQVIHSHEALYQVACYSALLGDAGTAISYLETILQADVQYTIRVANEPAFAGIKQQALKLLATIGLKRLQQKLQRNRLRLAIEKLEHEIKERKKMGISITQLKALLSKLKESSKSNE